MAQIRTGGSLEYRVQPTENSVDISIKARLEVAEKYAAVSFEFDDFNQRETCFKSKGACEFVNDVLGKQPRNLAVWYFHRPGEHESWSVEPRPKRLPEAVCELMYEERDLMVDHVAKALPLLRNRKESSVAAAKLVADRANQKKLQATVREFLKSPECEFWNSGVQQGAELFLNFLSAADDWAGALHHYQTLAQLAKLVMAQSPEFSGCVETCRTLKDGDYYSELGIEKVSREVNWSNWLSVIGADPAKLLYCTVSQLSLFSRMRHPQFQMLAVIEVLVATKCISRILDQDVASQFAADLIVDDETVRNDFAPKFVDSEYVISLIKDCDDLEHDSKSALEVWFAG